MAALVLGLKGNLILPPSLGAFKKNFDYLLIFRASNGRVMVFFCVANVIPQLGIPALLLLKLGFR